MSLNMKDIRDKINKQETELPDVDSMTKEEAALAGIEKLSEFIKEMGIPQTLREIGATEEMLPLIADSTILCGGYKVLTAEEVLEILKAAY